MRFHASIASSGCSAGSGQVAEQHVGAHALAVGGERLLEMLARRPRPAVHHLDLRELAVVVGDLALALAARRSPSTLRAVSIALFQSFSCL